ncbi:MAG: molecular chaperone DnaJ [Acidimicrobiia bacterium]|nr:molecular chaperone DnaJ [Acidimicrobiia bacterium]
MNRDWVDKDFYQTLGVGKSSPPEEIKRAYRKLARLHHPDANPGDQTEAEKFKEVSEAYSVLSDPERRKEYDDVRRLVESGGYRHFPGGGGGPGGPGGGQVNLEDLLGGMGGFGDLFGRGGRQAGARRGADLTAVLRLTFEESIEGVTKPIEVKGPAPCRDCRGVGARAGTHPETCPTCSGQGTTVQNQGFFSFSRPCPHCQGSGTTIKDLCPGCRGTGARHRTRQVRVRIPPGVKDGGRIRIRGKGAPGRSGGPAGDLVVGVEVERHPLFERNGKHLNLVLPLTYAEAALGATLEVPTLNGSVKLRIPPGTPNGKTFRLRGRGAPARKGKAGDLLVEARVEIPRRVSKQQRRLLEDLAALDREDIRSHFEVTA